MGKKYNITLLIKYFTKLPENTPKELIEIAGEEVSKLNPKDKLALKNMRNIAGIIKTDPEGFIFFLSKLAQTGKLDEMFGHASSLAHFLDTLMLADFEEEGKK